MQQGGAAAGGGGAGGSLSLYGISSTAEIASPIIAATTTSTTTHMMQQQQQQPVEAASPISSRPPQSLDELMVLAEDAIAGGGSSGGGNRWPRQETLALIKIRTDMDTAFRDATVKGPLWDDVSRKLAELGYRRNAKKCKEKFENVHKYYKRTRESRAGRQDGKSYKFFEQLEALHNTTPTTLTTTASVSVSVSASASASASQQQMPITTVTAGLDVSPVSVGIPMPISSVRTQTLPPPAQPRTNATNTIPPAAVTTPSASAQMSFNVFPHNLTATMPLPQPTLLPSPAAPVTAGTSIGLSFSSNTSSASSQGTEDDEEDDDHDDDESEGQPEPSDPSGFSRKRKRNSGGRSSRRMMEFFDKLMKQVTERQETMQQKFLEIIEKREQDRMIRDEAWKRQEMARLNREHEILAQERAVSASRDAAIVSFLQTLTGQTIQLPQQQPIPSFTPPPPPPQPAPPPAQPQPQHSSLPIPQQQLQIDHQPRQIQQNPSTEIVIAIPEQQITPQDISGGSFDPISSRWPKAEVLALINMRSSLEMKYEEAGPKGPLWEEISAGMMRLGYKRNAKRCKEKWENINKYFKKVKESNKKRPEDSKTCPYYHQLDALYQRKIIRSMSGGGGTSIGGGSAEHPPQLEAAPPVASTIGLPGSLFEEGNGASTKEPEDTVMKELMKQQRGIQVQQQQQYRQQLTVEDYEKMDETDSENTQIEDEEDEDEDVRKMDYKIEFQRKNSGGTNSGGGNNGAPSFMALVQ